MSLNWNVFIRVCHKALSHFCIFKILNHDWYKICWDVTWTCYLHYFAHWPKAFCVNNTDCQWRCELVKNKDRNVKKHKQRNKKKISQNPYIVFVCYRAQSAYKPALFSTQAKMTRSQVYINVPRYHEQLALQRRLIFSCTDSSDRPAYVLPRFDWGRLFPVALNCSLRAQTMSLTAEEFTTQSICGNKLAQYLLY